METISGIFDTRAAAEQVVRQTQSMGIPNDRIVLLTPDMNRKQVEHDVPTSDTETPGEGKALGGAVGGAIGAAGGVSLGAAAVSLLVPGVGPIMAGGILGAAILGIGGAATGMAVGEALDKGLADGLPHDELYLYEHALKNGRSVVIAFVDDEGSVERVRDEFEKSQAENLDATVEIWWQELRTGEEANYNSGGGNFHQDEQNYRLGFVAAQNSKLRDRHYQEASEQLDAMFGELCLDPAFRQGYERGYAYRNKLKENT